MVYGGIDEQREAIRNTARVLRSAAGMIPKIKPVMEKFNGKCYNCKLDNAIKELSDNSEEIRLYASVSYGGWYTITAYPKRGTNRDTNLLSAYSTKEKNRYMTDEKKKIFTDEKRLDAKKAVAILNENYAELMKKAAEYDRAADDLDVFLARIDELKKTLSAVKNSVPYGVLDICGIK